MSSTPATGAAPRVLQRGFYFRISITRGILLTLLFLAPRGVLFAARLARTKAAPAISHPSAKPNASPVQTPAVTGPWGELEVTPITIEAPAESAVRFAQADTSTWTFANCTREKLAGILKTAGLTDEQRDAVLASSTPDAAIGGFIAKPDSAVIVSLSHEARTALYQILSEDPKNPQAEPFRRRPDPANEWFADIGLSDQTVAMARRLVYRRGELEAFADVSAILPTLHTEAQRGALFRTLSSQSVLLVRLRIRPQTDVRPLIEYWGKGDRGREIGPLLESLAKVPGGDLINVAQLLPPFPRSRAYTYPRPIGTSANGQLDCHWTSLNFWNVTPDDRFSNPVLVREQLTNAYHVVDKPTELGDVIFLVDQKGQGIHSATYIAQDIVFTKNGTSVAAPWVFMRLPNLLSYYENADVVKTMVFRKNIIPSL